MSIGDNDSWNGPDDTIEHGHGHVYPRKDGEKMRCGGPGVCDVCSRDQAIKSHVDKTAHEKASLINKLNAKGPAMKDSKGKEIRVGHRVEWESPAYPGDPQRGIVSHIFPNQKILKVQYGPWDDIMTLAEENSHFLTIIDAVDEHSESAEAEEAVEMQMIERGADAYQQRAHEFAIYREEIERFVMDAIRDGQPFRIVSLISQCYAALGLASEAGEVAGKIKKMIRDDGGSLTLDRRDAIIGELGGVQWYNAITAQEIGASLGKVQTINLRVLQSRKARGKIQGDGDNR